MKPVETEMCIVIEDVFDEYDKEYYAHVSGKGGTLNKESDPEHFKDDEVGNQEVYMPLSSQIGQNGSPWRLSKNLSQITLN